MERQKRPNHRFRQSPAYHHDTRPRRRILATEGMTDPRSYMLPEAGKLEALPHRDSSTWKYPRPAVPASQTVDEDGPGQEVQRLMNIASHLP
jgi:hypothetical protein